MLLEVTYIIRIPKKFVNKKYRPGLLNICLHHTSLTLELTQKQSKDGR
jgi:hypothetical protein